MEDKDVQREAQRMLEQETEMIRLARHVLSGTGRMGERGMPPDIYVTLGVPQNEDNSDGEEVILTLTMIPDRARQIASELRELAKTEEFVQLSVAGLLVRGTKNGE